MTKIETESFELSEELSRYIFSAESDNGLQLIRCLSDISAKARGNCLHLEGSAEKIKLVKKFLDILSRRIEQHETINKIEVKRLFNQLATTRVPQRGVEENLNFTDIIASFSGRMVRAKTPNQQGYIEAIEDNTITIARGPAGTGKTYLATAMAVKALKEKKVSRVILARPVVEAGESLGYLPGDLKEKVDPHFRPLYDSLQEFVGIGKFEQYIRQGVFEITPLAYMRGRTFNESFVVLDEAQNTTLPQMRMVLTRLGYGSKMVVTGDHTQIDLPRTSDSSLLVLNEILGGVESVKFVDLATEDVIRHEVVRRIINAFDAYLDRERNKK
ncbi:MAG TPA: PhoH family protein [Candidatus Rifleibacterium sp.]|nr:PhoH family protein [Candidatus Rifleibacterium sp.]HPT45502.1 PhoH family protein [Candidatus Rifleibacterium sp.]